MTGDAGEIERVRVRPGPFGTFASNGQPYVTLTLTGTKAEGEAPETVPIPLTYGPEAAEEYAWMLYGEQFRKFAQDARLIEVRKWPELIWNSDRTRFWIYSRLAIVENLDG